MKFLPRLAVMVVMVTLQWACSSCSTDPDDDVTTVIEGCSELVDRDGDRLIGCADPDCADQPQCQVPWTWDLDAFLGAARFVPSDETGNTMASYMPSLAGSWRDLDGDGHPDTVLIVNCVDLLGSTTCIGDTPLHHATYLVQSDRLLEQSWVAYDPDEALDWQEITEEDLPERDLQCRGSIAVFDLDGDDFDDLIVAQPNAKSGPSLQIWWGAKGGPGLPRSADLEVIGEHPCAYVFEAGDVVGDDHEDLLVSGGPLPEGSIGLLPGGVRYNSLDVATFATVIQTFADGSYAIPVERAGDLVGDAREDVLVAIACSAIFSEQHPCGDRDQFLLAAFSGRTTWPAAMTLVDLDAGRLVPFEVPTSVVGVIDTGDLDGDGRTDVVFVDAWASHHEVFGGDSEGQGLGYVFSGAAGGWTGVERGEPIILLPPGFNTEKNFNAGVLVDDVDGDGFDDVVLLEAAGVEPSAISETYGVPLGDDPTVSVHYLVFEGHTDLLNVGDAGIFPDRLVLGGKANLPDFAGTAPETTPILASLSIDVDLDQDGIRDWVQFSIGNIDDTLPGDNIETRTVIEVFSGAKLLEIPR